jgi:hypothetical protein
MAEVAALLQQSFVFLSAGSLPPTHLLKALLSKVSAKANRKPTSAAM